MKLVFYPLSRSAVAVLEKHQAAISLMLYSRAGGVIIEYGLYTASAVDMVIVTLGIRFI